MAIETAKYIRKPLVVEAVQVTRENFMEMAFWCGGSIRNNNEDENTPSQPGMQIDPSNQHIKVDVQHPKNVRQSQAKVGDWILYVPEKGFKVYTDKAFQGSFDLATGEIMDQQHQQEKAQPEGEGFDEPQTPGENAGQVETELVREPVAEEAQEQVDQVKDDLETPEHQPPSQEGSETVTEESQPADDEATTEPEPSSDEPQDAEPTPQA